MSLGIARTGIATRVLRSFALIGCAPNRENSLEVLRALASAGSTAGERGHVQRRAHESETCQFPSTRGRIGRLKSSFCARTVVHVHAGPHGQVIQGRDAVGAIPEAAAGGRAKDRLEERHVRPGISRAGPADCITAHLVPTDRLSPERKHPPTRGCDTARAARQCASAEAHSECSPVRLPSLPPAENLRQKTPRLTPQRCWRGRSGSPPARLPGRPPAESPLTHGRARASLLLTACVHGRCSPGAHGGEAVPPPTRPSRGRPGPQRRAPQRGPP